MIKNKKYSYRTSYNITSDMKELHFLQKASFFGIYKKKIGLFGEYTIVITIKKKEEKNTASDQ